MEKLNVLHEGDNIGSLAEVSIAHCLDILDFNPVVFREGRDWLLVDFTPETGNLETDVTENENGILYTYKGKFAIHFPSEVLDQVMRPYLGQKAVLRLVDMNGRVYIIGHPDAPVMITLAGDTTGKFAGGPQNVYSYQAEQPFQAYYI